MKIGVDAREFLEKGKTGIGRYLENLLAPLARGVGIDFVIFAGRTDLVPETLRTPSVKIVALPGLPTPVVDQVVLPFLASREKVDIFFSPYYKAPLSGQFRRIITVHDIMFLRRQEFGPFTRFVIARQLGTSARKADVVLVDSDFTGRDLADFMPNLQNKIRRLYPDLSAAWTRPLGPEIISGIRKKYTLDKPFLLYVGNFTPHKNVRLLVEAFAQMVKGGRAGDTRLLLAGGDLQNLGRIERLIRDCGMGMRVAIHQNVSDEDLRGLYASADWFVTASNYEGFGYPALEAMVSGCPVICHPCTSLPEVVGKAALDIPALTVEGVAQALQQALGMKPAERMNLVESGKNQAKRFLPGSAAALFTRILSELTCMAFRGPAPGYDPAPLQGVFTPKG
jgi:glycosyltransferase involved in cell wall biosynthesis